MNDPGQSDEETGKKNRSSPLEIFSVPLSSLAFLRPHSSTTGRHLGRGRPSERDSEPDGHRAPTRTNTRRGSEFDALERKPGNGGDEDARRKFPPRKNSRELSSARLPGARFPGECRWEEPPGARRIPRRSSRGARLADSLRLPPAPHKVRIDPDI